MIIATVPLPVGDLEREYREAVLEYDESSDSVLLDGLLNVLSAHADEVATIARDAGE